MNQIQTRKLMLIVYNQLEKIFFFLVFYVNLIDKHIKFLTLFLILRILHAFGPLTGRPPWIMPCFYYVNIKPTTREYMDVKHNTNYIVALHRFFCVIRKPTFCNLNYLCIRLSTTSTPDTPFQFDLQVCNRTGSHDRQTAWPRCKLAISVFPEDTTTKCRFED